MKTFSIFLLCCLGWIHPQAEEPWRAALRGIPLDTNTLSIHKDRFFKATLGAFKPSGPVKSLVFLPGPTDDLYFKDFGILTLTNSQPNLLEALEGLTNRAPLFIAFHPPHVLVYSAEDRTNQLFSIQSSPSEAKLRKALFPGNWVIQDWDWDRVLKNMQANLPIKIEPELGSTESWHFYRAFAAAGDLSQWELMELLAHTTKTKVEVRDKKWVFKLRSFPAEDAAGVPTPK